MVIRRLSYPSHSLNRETFSEGRRTYGRTPVLYEFDINGTSSTGLVEEFSSAVRQFGRLSGAIEEFSSAVGRYERMPKPDR